MSLKSANRHRKKTAVLLIAPETGRLPNGMGPLARFISGKSGGLGDVIATLCEGLTRRGVECHLATLNLARRFRQENNLSNEQWEKAIHTIDPEHIHLVNSALFDNLPDAYSGNPVLSAAEFQKTLVNQIINRIRATNGGRLIIHSHDWMAGGVITADAKRRGCPVLHTLHNVHTADIPLDLFAGVDTAGLSDYLYRPEWGKPSIDCHATAIKNASLVNFVGARFLSEIVNDLVPDQSIIPPSVRREVKVKHEHGSTRTIINAPSLSMYPEHGEHLIRKYSPDDDVVAAKRENLVEFQKRTGLNVNPEAILLYWPSRLDPSQKGIELLEAIANRFVAVHEDVQIAIIGNGVGNDRTHEDRCGQIACSSNGRIAYQRFNEPLSMLGFAAASDVFGASLYEPCGQIDQIGNLFGATATNRDTGGYHDKIREMILKSDGAAEDAGNGFLFRDYDAGGLWYGLSRAVEFHRRPAEEREKQIQRIMKETREKHDPERMIDAYIRLYEEINGGMPLA